MPRWFSEKYIYVHKFMEYMLQFRELYPELDYIIEGFIAKHKNQINRSWYCPFRDKKVDDTVSRIKELYGATFPILLWNSEWEDVKAISWHYPFLLLVNNWYDDYIVQHNSLWNDILMTSIYIPKEFVVEKYQSFFLLRK
jgi:hypothetical protein